MARKVKGGKGSKRKTGRAARPRPVKAGKARKLASGSYSWRGKAVPFSRLPKAERTRIRSGWASKAAKVRKVAAKRKTESGAGRKRREWLARRTKWVPAHGKPEQYEGVLTPAEIAAKVPAKLIDKARAVHDGAHVAWVRQGKHGGGDALIMAESIRQELGEEIAAIMPQLWWYH